MLGDLDQAVVGDDLDTGGRGFVHRGGGGVAVFGDHDDGLGALGDHVVNLVVLRLDVVGGFLPHHVVALLLEQLFHQLLLVLPAFGGEVGEGEADLDLLTAGGRGGRRLGSFLDGRSRGLSCGCSPAGEEGGRDDDHHHDGEERPCRLVEHSRLLLWLTVAIRHEKRL